ncbi:hypothetical protein E2C01_014032 [Portunus trituberculatus]|uniref:Uncharacterized protein n=1 Tax=Portunus trituberculatus TaxID=210409 RepID=A0A5B7DJ22_PORTR|nr:hypothetical protein [Portunus trituberculatus]
MLYQVSPSSPSLSCTAQVSLEVRVMMDVQILQEKEKYQQIFQEETKVLADKLLRLSEKRHALGLCLTLY